MENTKYIPRTVEQVTMDSYRGQAILHIPVGEEKYDFAFGFKKVMEINKLVESGQWKKIVEDMKTLQGENDKINKRKNEVIQL